MPSTTSNNTPAQVQETKSKASKKKAKLANSAVAASPAADGSGNEASSPHQGTSVAGNDSSENAYIRELKKYVAFSSGLPFVGLSVTNTQLTRNIRNTNKKIVRRPPHTPDSDQIHKMQANISPTS